MKRSMHMGSRGIRSAGRGSGSVELTLPVDLAVLEGVTCHIELRDGLLPEVVLRPDLAFLRSVFEAVWDRLAVGLETVGEIGGFAESDYVTGLFCDGPQAGRPGLSYANALMVRHAPKAGEPAAGDGRGRALEAAARLIEAMATLAGQRLGLSFDMATLFGNQVAYAATGAPLAMVDAFVRGSLADICGDVGWCRDDPLAVDGWVAARPRLARLYDRLAAWDADDGGLREQREHWYRAHRVGPHGRLAGGRARQHRR